MKPIDDDDTKLAGAQNLANQLRPESLQGRLALAVRFWADGLCPALPALGNLFADPKPEPVTGGPRSSSFLASRAACRAFNGGPVTVPCFNGSQPPLR